MQHVQPRIDLPVTSAEPAQQADIEPTRQPDIKPEVVPQRTAAVWVERLTGVACAVFLLAGLAVWQFHPGHVHPGHYRVVLGLLVIAMFAAILHAYAFETGDDGS